MMKLGTFGRAALALAVSAAAMTVGAQAQQGPATTGLTVPENFEFLGNRNPNVRTATAIVNGAVITGTDVDHRVALIALANAVELPPEEMQVIRAQVLRNLVDETLQIQAAEQRDIRIDQTDIDAYFARFAQGFSQTPEQFAAYLRTVGSSDRSIKRQIHGELAWQRLQRRQIEPFVSVGDEEVNQIIQKLHASRGTREYRVAEIFLSATPESAAEMRVNAERIVQQVRSGASFVAYARQFSEASTAAVGGDLGWVRAEQLPDELAQVIRQIPVGAVSDPISIPGGFSIVALTDSRQILMPDARDAVLSLKQISIDFPQNMTRNQAAPRVEALARLGQTMGGCGRAEQAAAAIGAETLSRDDIRIRDLPPQLQEAMLNLNIGQATQPFGSFEEGVRILVLCGRDDPQDANAPTFDQVYTQLTEDRVNRRSQRFLRDLRRDAVVEYR
jgi:peptidyl-prolyl cis-trans isomerase SurA